MRPPISNSQAQRALPINPGRGRRFVSANCSAWAALWQSECKLDGKTQHIIHRNLLPALFKTRKQARAYIEQEYGYLRSRPDLQSEPHGWRMPKAIRVTITPND